MTLKRLFAIILVLLMLLSATSCGKETASEPEQSVTDSAVSETDAGMPDETAAETDAFTDDTDEKTDAESTEKAGDPSLWTTEQIVLFYKDAAKKTHSSVKSSHNVDIRSISVNNGQYEGLFEFITPIMSKLIANNSEDKDGITGGYNNLTAEDVASAKAYKSGNGTVIEMVMREQVSGAKEDANSGSVGHAITAVGDIGVVTDELRELGLPLDIPEKSIKIYYTNPTVKVFINSDGKIVNGTWRYTVEIRLDDYKAFGKAVETTSVVMDNTLTVNGGFKK